MSHFDRVDAHVRPIIEPPIQIPTAEVVRLVSETSRKLGYLEGLIVAVLARDDVKMPEDVQVMLGEAIS